MALRSSSEHSSMSLLIAVRDSLICRSTWLLGHEAFDLGAVQKNFAGDLKYLEPPFLDESRNCLPRNAADAGSVRLRHPIIPVLKIG
jgi:hypothetical protein